MKIYTEEKNRHGIRSCGLRVTLKQFDNHKVKRTEVKKSQPKLFPFLAFS